MNTKRLERSELGRRVYYAIETVKNYRNLTIRKRMAQELKGHVTFAIPKEKGFLSIPPGTWHETNEIVALVQEITKREVSGWEKGKAHLNTRLLDSQSLDLESPFLRLALHQDVLARVSEYLGMVPILNNIMVWCSRYTGEELQSSQLFHTDSEDRTQVKLFIYCQDVTKREGPLAAIDATASDSLRKNLKYTWGKRVEDEEVLNNIDSGSEISQFMGPTGSCFFVDTSRCFHYGSRISEPSSYRFAAVFQYLRPLAFKRYLKIPFEKLISSENSDLERMVLGYYI